MKRYTVGTTAALFFFAAVSCASDEGESALVDSQILAGVMDLYGLDEASAADRLAREAEAADIHQRLNEGSVAGYAGSWFDDKTQKLHVAISKTRDRARIERMGAVPVRVARSLDQLQAVVSRIREVADVDMGPGELRSLFVDFKSNSIVIGVSEADITGTLTKLQARGVDLGAVSVVAMEVVRPSAAFRGADGTRNLSYQQEYGQVRPCSVGASIVGGYITAAHCGRTGDQITSPSAQALGYMAESYWDTSVQLDSAWVSTYPGWEPKPEVNGYSDGIISVAAKWSGNAEAPVGSTVCRYGQTSGGPDCGTIQAVNQLIHVDGSGYINGVTRATDICSDDGDSGGSHITPAGQMQGTHIGGITTNTCPTPTTVFFQPIQDSLNAFGKIMLTAHGAAPPFISGFKCPDLNNSGGGIYSCLISHYNSQGTTTKSWSSSTGHRSTGLELWGSCATGATVTVNLSVTNPYGSSPKVASFPCPTGPMP